ncbi:hypothetical protein JTB14_003064 [Gonioctena quinquepunctata]|nr:hypothetical protein JTB14_003064 [Gonioctena quinquepunctata]
MELFILCLLTHQTIGLNHYCPGSLLVSDETIQGGFIDNSIINREDGKVCLCGIRPCIQKCCLQNEIKVNGKCEPEPEKVFDIPIYEEGNEKGNLSNSNFNIITGKDCQGEILRDPEVEIDGIMWIEEEGDLVGNNFTEYCIDTFDDQIGIVFCGNASTSVESNNMKRRVMSVVERNNNPLCNERSCYIMKLFLLCLLSHQTFSWNFSCPGKLLIPIDTVVGGFIENSVIYKEDDETLSITTIFECLCTTHPCIQKCCAQNEFKVDGECVPRSEKDFNITFYDEYNVSMETKMSDFTIISGVNCHGNHDGTSPSVQIDGSLLLEDDGYSYNMDFFEYCIDIFDGEIRTVYCGNASTSGENSNLITVRRLTMSYGEFCS